MAIYRIFDDPACRDALGILQQQVSEADALESMLLGAFVKPAPSETNLAHAVAAAAIVDARLNGIDNRLLCSGGYRALEDYLRKLSPPLNLAAFAASAIDELLKNSAGAIAARAGMQKTLGLIHARLLVFCDRAARGDTVTRAFTPPSTTKNKVSRGVYFFVMLAILIVPAVLLTFRGGFNAMYLYVFVPVVAIFALTMLSTFLRRNRAARQATREARSLQKRSETQRAPSDPTRSASLRKLLTTGIVIAVFLIIGLITSRMQSLGDVWYPLSLACFAIAQLGFFYAFFQGFSLLVVSSRSKQQQNDALFSRFVNEVAPRSLETQTPTQRSATMSYYYYYWMGEGGHAAYFSNNPADTDDMERALFAIGAQAFALNLDEASRASAPYAAFDARYAQIEPALKDILTAYILRSKAALGLDPKST